jgi:hypothetical protein
MAAQDTQGRKILSIKECSIDVLLFLELKLLFALFDVDNSGTLTRDELKQLLQSPDPDGPRVTEEQVAEYLKSADTDGEEPFISWTQRRKQFSVHRQWRCVAR